MEHTCKNCNHWDADKEALKDDDFGVCEKLSNGANERSDLIIPVTGHERIDNMDNKKVDYVTGSEFGCNQFNA